VHGNTLIASQPPTTDRRHHRALDRRSHRPPRITAENVRANRGCGGGCSIAMQSLQPAALLAMLVLLTRDGRAAPDITMSIHGDLAGSGTPSSFTVNQVSS